MNNIIIPPWTESGDSGRAEAAGEAGAGEAATEAPPSTCADGRAAAGAEDIVIDPAALDPPAPSSCRRGGEAKKYAPYNPADHDIGEVATRLLGPADGAGRWRCPFHADHNPSLSVDRSSGWYRCWTCGARGTAIDLVKRHHGLGESSRDFARSKDLLRSMNIGPALGFAPRAPGGTGSGQSGRSGSGRSGSGGSSRARGLSEGAASYFVWQGEQTLWDEDIPRASRWLGYLRAGRGLKDETIRAAKLGLLLGNKGQWPGWRQPPLGITIPWFDMDGQLVRLKIRQAAGMDAKYRELFTNRPLIYPGVSAIRPGLPLVITEGELDSLLLAQEIGDLCGVITLGSTSAKLTKDVLELAKAASIIYAAHDADPAGDAAAAEWPGAVRVRPPGPSKDWTESKVKGKVDLRAWWINILNNGPPSEPEPEPAPPPTVPKVSTVADAESRYLSYEDVDWRSPMLVDAF